MAICETTSNRSSTAEQSSIVPDHGTPVIAKEENEKEDIISTAPLIDSTESRAKTVDSAMKLRSADTAVSIADCSASTDICDSSSNTCATECIQNTPMNMCADSVSQPNDKYVTEVNIM